jgi:alkylation response protein AidB-like acyl-CoA dehydrogenase
MNAPDTARDAFAAWRAELAENAWVADPHARELLHRYGRMDTDGLAAFGADVSGPLDQMARETNRDENLPRLRRYDDVGRRVEEVTFHPDYHAAGRLAYRTGLMGLYREPGRELETLAYAYLLGQDGEAGHTCPFACTAGMIKSLQAAARDAAGGPVAAGSVTAAQAAAWLDRLYDPDYDTHAHGSQFLTEVQGGSDVGTNALVARLDGDRWRLSGEKWFCSVVDAQLFLVTARPEGAPPGTAGLGAFVVPRRLADGSPNQFAIRRLKYKLGTRSMASAELDFAGAEAWRVGDFRRTVEIVLNTSRVYNAMVAAGLLQRAAREAAAYSRHRTAFGRPIRTFPVVARIVASLQAEAHAARASTFWIADMADRVALARATGDEPAAWRMLVNLNKIWTALTCPAAVRDAIEVFGGNGAIEEFSVLPRLLRDAMVVEAWEGGHGVLCAQLLRDSQRLGLHLPLFRVLEATLPGGSFGDVRERWARVVALPEAEASWHVRDVVEELRVEVQAALLRAEASPRSRRLGEHLLATRRRGVDPLADGSLGARVQAILDDA